MGLECSAGAGGGVGGAWAGESAGSAVGGAEDWSIVGSAASSFWSWASMSGVGLSMSSGGPGAGDGDGVGSSSWDGWSLYVLDWLGLSMVIGSVRIRVRHAHASLRVEQEKECGARRWTLQCGASKVRSWIRSAVAVCWLTWRSVAVSVLMRWSREVWADGMWVLIQVLTARW